MGDGLELSGSNSAVQQCVHSSINKSRCIYTGFIFLRVAHLLPENLSPSLIPNHSIVCLRIQHFFCDCFVLLKRMSAFGSALKLCYEIYVENNYASIVFENTF